MNIIGIDCATQPRNVGLARGRLEDGTLTIYQVAAGDAVPLTGTIAEWMSSSTLLALDAPLGWPAPLPRVLSNHQAGDRIESDADELFNRTTDLTIRKRLNKRPLEVGAARIARTALVALRLLGEIRSQTGEAVPLLWEMGIPSETGAIEVYPAGTLTALGMTIPPYKRSGARSSRETLLHQLEPEITLETSTEAILDSSHLLDAILCVVAGADFLRQRCITPPSDDDEVRKEGWIWVRDPNQNLQEETEV